jgi:predicted GNAT family N-acyltransferase
MEIRPYRTSDIEDVVEIFRSNIPRYFSSGEESGLRDFLSNFSDDYFVVSVDGEAVGAGGIAPNNDGTVSLCWGMIRSDLLGTGLGRKLTEFRIRQAQKKYGPLPLVISTSQHTQGFYEKLGFRLLECRTDGFGAGIDRCEMRRDD